MVFSQRILFVDLNMRSVNIISIQSVSSKRWDGIPAKRTKDFSPNFCREGQYSESRCAFKILQLLNTNQAIQTSATCMMPISPLKIRPMRRATQDWICKGEAGIIYRVYASVCWNSGRTSTHFGDLSLMVDFEMRASEYLYG